MNDIKTLVAYFCVIVMSSCNGKSNSELPNRDSITCNSSRTLTAESKSESFVCRKDSGDLSIYMPKYKSIDLICGKRPEQNDVSVVYCAEAAFTGACLETFKHDNVAGNHVSGGVYYKGYKARSNTGAFVWYNGKWKFLYVNYAQEMKKAGKYGGMGFGQNMIVYNGHALPRFRKDKPENIYRALCELNGKLCIVESKNYLAYSEFVNLLVDLKVRNALYLDMGGGWNYSWYRDSTGCVHEIHPQTCGSKYQTNWIVFKE